MVSWSGTLTRISFLWGARLTLERRADSDIDAMTAVWMTVLANEIHEAAASQSNNNSRSN